MNRKRQNGKEDAIDDTDLKDVRLSDVLWGGRVRRAYQERVKEIARRSSLPRETRYSGGMLASSVTTCYRFLDGALVESRGFFDASCGMFLTGTLATAHVLYQLGLDARTLLKGNDLPGMDELAVCVEEVRAGGRSFEEP